jgi:thiol:disulfide interchange protein DsbD
MLELLNEWSYALKQALESQLHAGSLSAIFIVFAAGVLTSFTPCVYPMIPVIVTFMGGAAAGSRRRVFTLSAVYVLGLALVYTSLGIASALLGMTFGQSWRSPIVFGSVSVLMIVFGLAMLDVITIPIPGFFGSVQTRGASRGGHLGALLMGLASGFVAAPCTAPVLGVLLLYVARTRDVLWGGTLMLAFSLGLSLLLLVLAVSSGLLTNMPRAGKWMDWIKKGFGVGMLLVAAWFLYQTIIMLVYRSGA